MSFRCMPIIAFTLNRVQSYDFFSFPPNLSTCFSFFYSVFYFYRYVAQVVALVLGIRCPSCGQWLLVPCSPAPHRVFIEGPSDGHCRKQKSPLPVERQWGFLILFFVFFVLLQSNDDFLNVECTLGVVPQGKELSIVRTEVVSLSICGETICGGFAC